MIRAALLGALLFACGAAPDPAVDALPATVLRPETESLWALMLEADLRWEAAGAAADRMRVEEPGPLSDSRWVTDAAAECDAEPDEGSQIDGCALPGRMLLRADLEPERAAETVLHELGHLLGVSHLVDCPEHARGSHVMCAYGRGVPELSAADAAALPEGRWP